MNMLQVAVLGVAGVLLAVQFKGGKTEYSTYIALGVSVLFSQQYLDSWKYWWILCVMIGDTIGLVEFIFA